jgi:hypothetical protein
MLVRSALLGGFHPANHNDKKAFAKNFHAK